MDDAGARIDAGVQAAGGSQAPVPAGQVISDLQSRMKDLQDSNGVPLSAQAAKRISALQQRVNQVRSKRTGILRTLRAALRCHKRDVLATPQQKSNGE
jgi:hypothetical protein